MTVSLTLRIIVIAVGVLLFAITFFMYAKRKLTDNIALSWAAASVVLILAGAIEAWSGWSKALATGTYIMIFCAAGVGILIVYRICIYLSELVIKTQELTMHVSILNEEVEALRKKIDELSGENNE